MEHRKIKTYFNLLKRSGKIIFGNDAIQKYKKKAYLIIITNNFSDKINIIKKSVTLNCKLYETDFKVLNDLLETNNCKVVLIKNYDLANAIIVENLKINLLREVIVFESTTKQ